MKIYLWRLKLSSIFQMSGAGVKFLISFMGVTSFDSLSWTQIKISINSRRKLINDPIILQAQVEALPNNYRFSLQNENHVKIPSTGVWNRKNDWYFCSDFLNGFLRELFVNGTNLAEFMLRYFIIFLILFPFKYCCGRFWCFILISIYEHFYGKMEWLMMGTV